MGRFQSFAKRLLPNVLLVMALAGCVTTSMQGYADRQLPGRPLQRLAVYVSAPGQLAASLQASVRDQARSVGIVADDAFDLLPPTRTYTDNEVRNALVSRQTDGVLILAVGDTGVVKEYAGTFLHATYSGSSSATGTATRFGNATDISVSGTTTGRMVGSTTPIHRYSRQTVFSARLVDPQSGRNLWVGSGQVDAGGALFVGDRTSASSAVEAIFKELRAKGLITGPT